MHEDINVAVGGPVNADYPKVYKTKFLKPGIPFGLQVTDIDTKYVIKYNFDLGGESVTIPEGCLLEFDGGSLNGGIIVGNNTIIRNLSKIGDVTLCGEFIDDNGRHISNHYKVPQKKNIHLSSPLGYYELDKHLDERMMFQRKLGFDYYHLTVGVNVNVDGNGVPTSLKFRSKDFSVPYNTVEELTSALINCIDNNPFGILDGIKFHTEDTAIDTILEGNDTNKILAFLSLYEDALENIFTALGNRCSKFENVFMLNEEPHLMTLATNTTELLEALSSIRATIKSKCPNARVMIAACVNNIVGFCQDTLCYTDAMKELVDACGVNFYLIDISLNGRETALDCALIENAIMFNKDIFDFATYGFCDDFYITESGCSNKEVSLANGSYWQQNTTNDMNHPFYAAYIYFTTLFGLFDCYGDKIKYFAHWFLNGYYYDGDTLKDFYGGVYNDTVYADKMIILFRQYFYE